MSQQRNRRVGFWLGDASAQSGGVGPYALRVLDALVADTEPGWEIVLLHGARAQRDANATLARSTTATGIRQIPFEHGPNLKNWIEELNLDLLHFPTPTQPFPGGHTAYLVPELLAVTVPHILTVHDLQELRFPEYFSPAQRAIRAMHHWEALDKARKIIVSYDHIRLDLIKYFKALENKIEVCPIPFRSIRLPEPSHARAVAFNDKYERFRPFLLYPAQTWRHKNHVTLLRALQLVREQSRIDLHLICTGGLTDHHSEIAAEIRALSLSDAALFTGLVPEDELAWLYRHAACVTIPTEYEAGSFPLMEAMAEAVPVICSNVTSLPETIGDPRFTFNPDDADALARLIVRIIESESFRQENIDNSVRQAKRLRGVKAARYFYNAYRRALDENIA